MEGRVERRPRRISARAVARVTTLLPSTSASSRQRSRSIRPSTCPTRSMSSTPMTPDRWTRSLRTPSHSSSRLLRILPENSTRKAWANPVLRDITERVIIASKGRFDRALSPTQRLESGFPSTATISRDEFMEATTDLWEISPESATKVGHPAPFPVELPKRLIELSPTRATSF